MDSFKKLTQQLFITLLFIACLVLTVQQSHAGGAGNCAVDSSGLCKKTGASCTMDSGDEGKCKSYLQRGCKCLAKKKSLNSFIIKEKKPSLGIIKKPANNTTGLVKPISKEPLRLPESTSNSTAVSN